MSLGASTCPMRPCIDNGRQNESWGAISRPEMSCANNRCLRPEVCVPPFCRPNESLSATTCPATSSIDNRRQNEPWGAGMCPARSCVDNQRPNESLGACVVKSRSPSLLVCCFVSDYLGYEVDTMPVLTGGGFNLSLLVCVMISF